MKPSTTVLLTLAILWPTDARAYRPFDSTDAAVARYGEAEIEIGPGYLVESGARAMVAPRTVVNLGVLPRLELVIEGVGLVPLQSEPTASRYRLDDTGLFLKGILREGALQDHSGPSIATETGVLLPTLHADAGTGASLAVMVSQQWDWLTIHANAQVLRTRSKDLGLFGGIILEGPGSWTRRPVAEVFVYRDGRSVETLSGLVGVLWRVSDTLSFDAAFRAARQGDIEEYEVRVGLTYDIRFWGKA